MDESSKKEMFVMFHVYEMYNLSEFGNHHTSTHFDHEDGGSMHIGNVDNTI
jgi:hypothetical protein